ncbi:MAG: diguanylate cyclase [bacterium]
MKIRLPIGSRLFLSHFITVLLVSGSVGTYFYLSAVDSLMGSLRTRLQSSAAIISQALDVGRLDAIQSARDVELPAYQETLAELRRFRQTNPDIAFLYVMRLSGSDVYFVVDTDESEQQALPGRPYSTVPPAMLQGFLKPSVDPKIWEDEWGAFLSGYAPVRQGKGRYLVGIDMRAMEVRSKLRNIHTAGILSLTCSILMALLFSRLLSFELVTPIRVLIERCSAVAQGHLDERIKIRAVDELDQLLQAFNSMSDRLGESRERHLEAEGALKRAKDELEFRVEERTRELTDLNQKLVHEIAERRKAEEALALAARTDALTGALNRRAILEHLQYQAVQCERNRSLFTILLCDVDHFKPINDTFGHDVGDLVLRSVSEVLREAVRKQDLVARWGGEEFLMMLPDTDLKGGLQVAEKMRKLVNSRVFPVGPHEVRITLSIGVSAYLPGQKIDDCIKQADQALYQAKHLGRNHVSAAGDPSRSIPPPA